MVEIKKQKICKVYVVGILDENKKVLNFQQDFLIP